MQLLKPLTLLLFVLVSVNSFAQSYKVTVKEVTDLSCKNNIALTQRMCLVGVDNTELTPLCGMMDCKLEDAPINFPAQLIDSFPTELGFPAAGMLETAVSFKGAVWPADYLTLAAQQTIGVFYGAAADSVKGSFRLPPFTLQLRGQSLPNPGECKSITERSTKPIKNRRFRVAANQVTQVMSALVIGEGVTLPPDLVPIPRGQIARMKTNFNQTIPLRDIDEFEVEICNTEIQGYIDISLAFRAVSPIDYASWDFSGGLRVSASPTDETLEDYVGTIDGGAIIFSSDVEGALTNAEDVYPDTISTSFRYEEDTNPDDDVLGWMDIDFSSLPNQQWQSLKLDWVYPDGRPHSSEFGNVFAMGLGQLVRTSPGSSPLSMKLPVIKKGGDPMTLTIPMGVTGNSLTIEYALFGASGSDSP